MPLQQTGGVKVIGLYCEVVSNGRVDFPAGAPIGRLQNSCPRDKFAQPFPGRTRKRVSRKRLVDEPSWQDDATYDCSNVPGTGYCISARLLGDATAPHLAPPAPHI